MGTVITIIAMCHLIVPILGIILVGMILENRKHKRMLNVALRLALRRR